MKIEKGRRVKLKVDLSVAGGQQLEKSTVEYVQGAGSMLSGLEAVLEGLEKGAKRDGTLKAKDAFGNPAMHPLKKMKRSDFPKDAKLTEGEKLIAAVSINESCTSCHAAKRGPFLWAHVPVLESCLNCHHAHGSNLQSLLRVQMPRLCQQCHANSGHNSRPFTPPGIVPSSRVYNRSCVNCHVAIHGSNHPSGVVFTR